MITFLLAAASAAPYDAEATRDAMAGHWASATAARDAVIAGDLAAAKAVGASFKDRPAEDDLIARDARKRLASRYLALERASDLPAAAKAVGEIALVCGGCHTKEGVTRSFEPPEPHGASAMQHHKAGAGWMWAGVVGSSNRLFDYGVKVLAEGNLVPGGMPLGTPDQRAAAQLEIKVQDLAAAAGRTTDPKRRAALFGEMIGTCAACHQVTAGGPDPQPVHTPDAIAGEMHVHFALLTAARQAVQRGDLEAAKARGSDIVQLDPPTGLNPPWRPFVAEMKADAAKLADATALREAAMAVSGIAISCAGCHTAMQGGPTPPDRDALEGQAGRDTGLGVLWIALLSESDEAWALGAEMLGADAPPYSLLDASTAEERARVFSVLLTP